MQFFLEKRKDNEEGSKLHIPRDSDVQNSETQSQYLFDMCPCRLLGLVESPAQVTLPLEALHKAERLPSKHKMYLFLEGERFYMETLRLVVRIRVGFAPM